MIVQNPLTGAASGQIDGAVAMRRLGKNIMRTYVQDINESKEQPSVSWREHWKDIIKLSKSMMAYTKVTAKEKKAGLNNYSKSVKEAKKAYTTQAPGVFVLDGKNIQPSEPTKYANGYTTSLSYSSYSANRMQYLNETWEYSSDSLDESNSPQMAWLVWLDVSNNVMRNTNIMVNVQNFNSNIRTISEYQQGYYAGQILQAGLLITEKSGKQYYVFDDRTITLRKISFGFWLWEYTGYETEGCPTGLEIWQRSAKKTIVPTYDKNIYEYTCDIDVTAAYTIVVHIDMENVTATINGEQPTGATASSCTWLKTVATIPTGYGIDIIKGRSHRKYSIGFI